MTLTNMRRLSHISYQHDQLDESSLKFRGIMETVPFLLHFSIKFLYATVYIKSSTWTQYSDYFGPESSMRRRVVWRLILGYTVCIYAKKIGRPACMGYFFTKE